MSITPVLIAGAGPTGLALALDLTARRVPVMIVDPAEGPGTTSRAMVVHARTLELYRFLGLGDEVVAQGIRVDKVHLRRADPKGPGRDLAGVDFGEIGKGLTPYPFVLAYAQDDHERLLLAHLERRGVHVQWGIRLETFTQDDTRVLANGG